MGQLDKNSVTAAEIIRNFGLWQAKALTEPVVVTHHGRPRLVLQSVEAFEASRSPRGAVATPDIPGADILPQLMNHMSEAFAAYDPDLRIVEMNRAYEAFFDLGRGEAIGKTFLEVFPDADRSITHDRLQRTIRTGQSFQFETQSTVQKGRRIAVNVFPVRGGAGLLFTNTTEHELLSENQDSYTALVEALCTHSAITAARLDSRGRILGQHTKLALLLGITEADLLGGRIYDLVVSRDRRRIQDAFELSWEERQPREVEADFMQRGGEDIPLHVTFSPVVHDFTVTSALMVATKALA